MRRRRTVAPRVRRDVDSFRIDDVDHPPAFRGQARGDEAAVALPGETLAAENGGRGTFGQGCQLFNALAEGFSSDVGLVAPRSVAA